MPTLDLNKLRDTILANQRDAETLPVSQQKKVVVDREGRIAVGPQSTSLAGPVTEVPQDTFHTTPSHALLEARQYLPPTTRLDIIDGFEVFTYSVETSLGIKFVLAAYFDGSNYQVQLVEPELENEWKSPHRAHIFSSDGRLCLSNSHGGGQPTLRRAFAKSVVWAEGVAAMLAGSPVFPYSINNEDDPS
ncbi:MAG: hypothetical protein JSU08_03580 [Acidobacteria bacterium]|nr:hypothetical protein [Acidobacteriota bacterium]